MLLGSGPRGKGADVQDESKVPTRPELLLRTEGVLHNRCARQSARTQVPYRSAAPLLVFVQVHLTRGREVPTNHLAVRQAPQLNRSIPMPFRVFPIATLPGLPGCEALAAQISRH